MASAMDSDLILPTELWANIFAHVDSFEDWRSLSQVCQSFRRLWLRHLRAWIDTDWLSRLTFRTGYWRLPREGSPDDVPYVEDAVTGALVRSACRVDDEGFQTEFFESIRTKLPRVVFFVPYCDDGLCDCWKKKPKKWVNTRRARRVRRVVYHRLGRQASSKTSSSHQFRVTFLACAEPENVVSIRHRSAATNLVAREPRPRSSDPQVV